jgi:hypothetical protein
VSGYNFHFFAGSLFIKTMTLWVLDQNELHTKSLFQTNNKTTTTKEWMTGQEKKIESLRLATGSSLSPICQNPGT